MLCGGAINGLRQKKVRAKIDPGRGNTYPKLVGRLVGSMDLFLWKIETGNPGSPWLPWKMVVSCRIPWIQFLDFSGNGFPQPASSSLALGFGTLCVPFGTANQCFYPPVIEAFPMEVLPYWYFVFPWEPPFSSGISQLAMFDYQMVLFNNAIAISRRLVVQETLPFLYCLHIPHLCLSAGWLTNSHTHCINNHK